MSSESPVLPDLAFHPLSPERWGDLEALFGEHGGDDGCWCMWWRLTRAQFARQVGDQNKQALKRIVDSGEVPGILAYAADQPIAWCSISPREAFPALNRSRRLKKVDDQPVWSVVCFFVARQWRGKGVMLPLLSAAVAYAKAHGAKIVEGYPVEGERTLPAGSAYLGIAAVFRQAGFVEVLRRGEHRPIMRHFVS